MKNLTDLGPFKKTIHRKLDPGWKEAFNAEATYENI